MNKITHTFTGLIAAVVLGISSTAFGDFMVCDGSIIDETFDSYTPGDGVAPTDWALVGNSYQYIGVDDRYGARGFELQNRPVNTNGSLYTPNNLGWFSEPFGVEFDFVPHGTCVNFILMATNSTTYGTRNQIYIDGDASTGYDLTDLSGSVVAHLNSDEWYHFVFSYDESANYNMYLGKYLIASGSATSVTSGYNRIMMGQYEAANGGNVFYDNFQVGNVSLVPEPATMILLGLGMLWGMKRRR